MSDPFVTSESDRDDADQKKRFVVEKVTRQPHPRAAVRETKLGLVISLILEKIHFFQSLAKQQHYELAQIMEVMYFNTNDDLRQQQLAMNPLGHLSDFFGEDGTLRDPLLYGGFDQVPIPGQQQGGQVGCPIHLHLQETLHLGDPCCTLPMALAVP